MWYPTISSYACANLSTVNTQVDFFLDSNEVPRALFTPMSGFPNALESWR